MNSSLKQLDRIKDILDIDGKTIVGEFSKYEEAISNINLGNEDLQNVVVRFLKKIKSDVIDSLKKGKFVKVSSSIGIYSLLISSESNEEEFFILSPYLENHISLEDYQELLSKQGVSMFEYTEDILYSIPVISKKKFNYILEFLFGEDNINFDDIEIFEDNDVKNSKKIFFDRHYVVREILEKKARFNKELKEACINGDITKIKMLFDLEFDSIRNDNIFVMGDNKMKERQEYINDTMHFIFSSSEASPLDVNSQWIKIKNKLDNYDFSNDIIREYCLLIDKERYKEKQQVVRNCILYINDHIREKISLNDISDYLGVNKSYLSSIFNREMGFSIVDYIHDKRISNSKYLLANTDFSISEISDYIGYFDTSYFIRIFKVVTNTTPLKYRENSLL